MLHRAGMFQLCAAFLSEGCSLEHTGDCQYLRCALVLIVTAFQASNPLMDRIRHLLLTQPGALTGLALTASTVGTSWLVQTRRMFDYMRDDVALSANPEWWLLDSHYAGFALLQLRAHAAFGAVFITPFVQQWCEERCMRALAQPLPQQQLSAAVSLAMLAAESAQARELLAREQRLETLVSGLLEVTTGAYDARRCGSTTC